MLACVTAENRRILVYAIITACLIAASRGALYLVELWADWRFDHFGPVIIR